MLPLLLILQKKNIYKNLLLILSNEIISDAYTICRPNKTNKQKIKTKLWS
jgi:hypothetical protein